MTKGQWIFRDALTGERIDLTPLSRPKPTRRITKRPKRRTRSIHDHTLFLATAAVLALYIIITQ